MKQNHTVNDLRFESDELVVTIDGTCRRFVLQEISPVLKNAPPKLRKIFEISPSGYGIHWPGLDEDLSIDGLLCIVHERRHKRQVA